MGALSMRTFTKRWLVGCCMAGLAGTASITATAQAPDAEQQLEAIRRALLEQATGAPTRVFSVAWIDGAGRLHESTQITSDMVVRGVRIPSDQWPSDDPVEALVPAVSLPVGLAGAAATDTAEACLQALGPWRDNLRLEVALGSLWPGATPHEGQHLLAALSHGLLATAQAAPGRWRVQAAQPATSPYGHWLTDRASDAAQWRLRVRLEGGIASPPATGPWPLRWGAAPEPERWLSLSLLLEPLQAAEGAAPRPPVRVALPVPRQARGASDGRFALWEPALQAAWQAFEQASACESLRYPVARQGEALQLVAGVPQGARVGQRLLVMDASRLPRHVLEPAQLGRLGMAEVVRVHPGSAELRWLAGPKPDHDGQWMAVPL
jgi:hypothetical protein